MQIEVDGQQVYAATGGRSFDPAKPAIVFLHGAGMDHTIWQLPARSFAWNGFSVLAIDLPGHGRSDGQALTSIADLATWTRKLLDAAKVSKAALVGHSMGGSIALEVAAANPERVSHVALLGTAAAVPVHPDLLQTARDAPERAYGMMTNWALGHAAKIGGNPAPGLWMTGGTLALFARNQPAVLATDLAACNAWATGKESARKVHCPALVVIAANDVMTSPKIGRELAALIPGSRTVMLSNSGHMLMMEKPDDVLDALRAFLVSAKAH
jgi:pimeloyl-ACP methyl ester carboxylesterase